MTIYPLSHVPKGLPNVGSLNPSAAAAAAAAAGNAALRMLQPPFVYTGMLPGQDSALLAQLGWPGTFMVNAAQPAMVGGGEGAVGVDMDTATAQGLMELAHRDGKNSA